MYVRGNWMFLQVEKGYFVASERVLEQATEGKPHTIRECLLKPRSLQPSERKGGLVPPHGTI